MKKFLDFDGLSYYDVKIKEYINDFINKLDGTDFVKEKLDEYAETLKEDMSEHYQTITANNLILESDESEIDWDTVSIDVGYVSVLTTSVIAFSDVDWVETTVDASTSTITVTPTQNTGLTRRSATIYVSNGYAILKHTVIQHASDASNCTELEYLVSSESLQQYIDTGFGVGMSPRDFKIEIKGAMDYATPTQTGCFFGSRESTNTYRFDLCRNSTKLFRVSCGTNVSTKQSVAFNASDFVGVNTFTVDGRNSVVYCNDVPYAFNFENFNIKYPLWLFGENTSNAINGNFYENKAIFHFKIWDIRGRLIREYYPMLDENDKPCMYETLSRTKLYNSNPNGADFLTPYEYMISNASELTDLQSDGSEDEDLL